MLMTVPEEVVTIRADGGALPFPSFAIRERNRVRHILVVALGLAVLMAAACGGGGGQDHGTRILLVVEASSSADRAVVQQRHPSKSMHPRLTVDTMSQAVRRMEYAVRGAVVILADEISRELQKNNNDINNNKNNQTKYPLFDHIVYTDIGNPQYVAFATSYVCSSFFVTVAIK